MDSEELIHKTVYGAPLHPLAAKVTQYSDIIVNCDNEEIIRVSNPLRKLTEAIKRHYAL